MDTTRRPIASPFTNRSLSSRRLVWNSTLVNAESSRKPHEYVRSIYAAASGIARVNGTADNYVYSDSLNVERDVIQGDIKSPVLFILAFDTWTHQHDSVCRKVFKCGHILRLLF